MATGQEEPTVSSNANVPAKVTEEKDRFQEGKTEEHRNIYSNFTGTKTEI